MKDPLRVTIIFFALLFVAEALPRHGNFQGINIPVNGSYVAGSQINSFIPPSLAMISNSPIRVSLHSALFDNEKSTAEVEIKIILYESQCETTDREASQSRELATNTQTLKLQNGNTLIRFQMNNTVVKSNTVVVDTSGKTKRGTKKSGKVDDPAATTNPSTENETSPTPDSTTTTSTPSDIIVNKINTNKTDWHTFSANSSGIYVVVIEIWNKKMIKGFYNLTFDVEMKNRFGYISLVDYPALIVYSILMVVYIFYAFTWLIMMAWQYKDIIRLQFWIIGVILLGFLEKIFFVAEYGSANEGHKSSGLVYVAEGVSAGKRALARVLIIIVCEGFGIVKPRLGPTLTKVLVVGGIYFVAAFIEGITRASKATTEGFDLTGTVTFILLYLIEIGIIYWIFSALVNTRRTLRVRKNTVKLSLYNHLAYALIATIIASIAFTVWYLIAVLREGCISDWREIWLNDCFWHMLFCFVLLVVMIIWRPSANNLRFAYSQVNVESDDDQDQGANKNFDTIKMRTIPQPDGPKPMIMSQEAEDDLKWAEENLPTTIIDKTLPVLLDSEEEVMTTKFESSKMN